MALNFNAEPYFDDFDEDKKFYRVLFRPGYAVQARELTQLQTILQKQVERFGNHMFQEGSQVIPGSISIDTEVAYVKLQPTYNSASVNGFISNLQDEVVVGQTSGVRALVIKTAGATSTEDDVLMVKYLDSGTDNDTKVFANNEVIAPETASSSYTVQAKATSATGTGSLASVERGIYYVKGFFTLVTSQSLILDKFGSTPSYRVGLTITESFVDSDSDETLLDNAQGSYNFAAPGANRYKIDLTLAKLSTTSEADDDFLELARVENGSVKQKVNRTDYNLLEQTLARRTYDESGDYTVSPFKIDIREHRDNNRGTWATSTAYLANDVVVYGGNYYTAKDSGTSASTAPTHTVGEATDGVGGVTWLYDPNPVFNRGVYTPANGGDESKLAVGLEPGKAYVRGYEIEKISTEYVAIDKARDTDDVLAAKISSKVGNYVLVKNVHSVPPIDTLAEIELYDELGASDGASNGTQIGTARARFMEYHSGATTYDDTTVYKLSLFDIQMNSGKDFNKDVKMFYYDSGVTATSFTADISPVQTLLTGSVTASSSTTLTGTGTIFTSELSVGDFIYVGSSSVVRRVEAITDNNDITVDTAVTATGVVVYKLTTEVKEPNNNPALFVFPYNSIESVRDSGGSNLTSYSVYEKFTQTSNGSGVLTLTVSGGNDVFAENDDDEYYVVRNDTGAVITPSSITRTSGNTQVEIAGCPNSTSCTAIATVQKSGTGTEKTKTLTTVTAQNKTTESTATVRTIDLGKADGYRLLSVKMDTGTFGSPSGTYSIDITDRYDFDDGQRLAYYDTAKVILKDGQPAPTAPISIAFQYFAHSGTGDYFTVNSYSGITYDRIPSFLGYPLTDVYDFRPRINDAGDGFTGTGALMSLPPKRGVDITSYFSFYLERKDKIALDIKGNFFSVTGVSDLNASEPNDPSTGMLLYKLNLPAYTLKASSVEVKSIDNRRYTMRDIGKIEKRVENLEYYTSLSLLETETQSLTIKDADGLDRFKNGFVVDNFKSQVVGNVSSNDYKCSIDMENGELRPFFSMKNVNLIEGNTDDADRTTDGYQITGDLITLPYTHTALVDQPYASRTENVNPFAIFTFLGRTQLNPASDEWIEVDRRPDIVQDVEGNFAAVSAIAEAQGVLGTVWNAWQTTWTGQTTTSRGSAWFNPHGSFQTSGNTVATERAANFLLAQNRRNTMARTVVFETTATQVGQSRTGVQTSVVSRVDRELVNDRLISSAVIPYIRSRNIMFSTRGLKPNTTLYPFFDGTDVSDYITPATKVSFTSVSGFSTDFDSTSSAGGDTSETARRFSGDTDVALNKGDVVYVATRSSTNYTKATSPAYGVVVGQELVDSVLSIYVVNITGTFTASDVIVGSLSSARGTVTSTVTNKSQGDALVSNANGDLYGIFNLPNTDSLRFRTGRREFKLIDNSTNTQGTSTTSSRTQYDAKGALQTRQSTFNAVRNAEIVQNLVTDTQTIVQTSDRVISDTGWWDPLAQTFLVQQEGGAFLTKVDLFFATKDANIPVQCEIREVVNGYPGKTVLPFSRVVKPAADVNLSSSTVTVDGTTYNAPDTATTFTFDSPVYVEDGQEYCIVVLSDSTDYTMWISQLGELNAGTERFISEQPYAGVLFKSQNASTWTANQYQDMKFKLYRASFTTATQGNVVFTNDILPVKSLQAQPIATVSGESKVRVLHPGHGMAAGDNVTIAGAEDTNGITAAQLNTDQTIESVEMDSYVIDTAGTATASGFGGGLSVTATENIPFSVVQPITSQQSFADATLDWSIKTTSGTSVSGTEAAYSTDASYFGIIANDNNYLTTQRIVASNINEADASMLNGAKSLFLKGTLYSTNESISPVIDTERLSAVLVNNKINEPTSASVNDADLDNRTVVSSNTNVAFTASTDTISSADSTTQAALATVSVGRYITITGSSEAANNSTFLVTAVTSSGTITVDGALADDAAGDSVTITVAERFVDEISPLGSSSYSKYVTRKVNLENPSTFLRVKLALDVPPNADFKVYYRTLAVGSSQDFDTISYTEMTPDSTLITNSDQQFYDVDYTLSDIAPFDAFNVKLVFNSTDQSQVPRVKDLRIIACA